MTIKYPQILGSVKMALIDVHIESNKRRLTVIKDDIPCKAGCAGCCKRLINITVAEAVIMYDNLKNNGAWNSVRKASLEQLPLIEGVDPVSWFLINQNCPALDEKTQKCKAYAARPAICSAHFVKSNPDLCNPHSVNQGKYEAIDFNDLIEKFLVKLIESTPSFSVFQIQVPLPMALLIAESISVNTGQTINQALTKFLKPK